MFAFGPSINPPCNDWLDDVLPKLCKIKVEQICQDILKKGEATQYSEIYDTIYEIVQDEINLEKFEQFYYEEL